MNLVDQISYPDHYKYSEKDLSKLLDLAKKLKAGLVTTEKDFVRLNKNYQKEISYLKLHLEILDKKRFFIQIKLSRTKK